MTDVLATLQKLPELCAALHPSDGSKIVIRRGVPGYTHAHPRIDVDEFNREEGVTPAQVEAMLVGSLFGWHVPGADPDKYTPPVAAGATPKAVMDRFPKTLARLAEREGETFDTPSEGGRPRVAKFGLDGERPGSSARERTMPHNRAQAMQDVIQKWFSEYIILSKPNAPHELFLVLRNLWAELSIEAGADRTTGTG
jgi:hypothetical protein